MNHLPPITKPPASQATLLWAIAMCGVWTACLLIGMYLKNKGVLS